MHIFVRVPCVLNGAKIRDKKFFQRIPFKQPGIHLLFYPKEVESKIHAYFFVIVFARSATRCSENFLSVFCLN